MIWSKSVVRKGKVISLSDLELNSNLKVSCTCDACNVEFCSTYQSVVRQGDFHLCRPCARKAIGIYTDQSKNARRLKEQIGPKHPRWNPNKSAWKSYSNRARWISECVYNEHIEILNPDRHPRTLCGVPGGWQLDHKKSVKACFDEGLSPEECSKLSNLQLLPWQVNRTKSDKREYKT